jgi:anti-sigma B factor antagonist
MPAPQMPAAPSPGAPTGLATTLFSAHVGVEGGTTLVTFMGELDLSGVVQARAALEQARRRGPGDVVVDLAALSFIDAGGIGALVDAAHVLQADGSRLLLRSPSPLTRKVLLALQLDRVLVVDGP